MISRPRQPASVPIDWVLGGLLGVGALVRIWAFAIRGALWTDEAGLALNIVGRNLRDIARPFVYDQYAPYLYVISDKLVTLALGASEHALRFASLLAGLALLPLLALLARRVADERAVVFALLLLVPNHIAVLYSSELKPYEQDALITSVLLLLTLRTWSPVVPRSRALLLLAAVGALAPWFSLPAIFILGAIAAALLVDVWERKLGARACWAVIAIGAVWLVSFALHYFAFLSVDSKSTQLQDYWARLDVFAPFPLRSLGDLHWYAAKLFYLFSVFVTTRGFGLRYLAALAWLPGMWLLWKKSRALGVLWIAALPLAFAASAAHKYIIADRLTLFMAPLLLVPVALSLSALSRFHRAGELIAASLVALLCVPAALTLPERLIVSSSRTDIRTTVGYLQQHFRSDDRLYVETQLEWPYAYYAGRAKFSAAWSIASGYAKTDDAVAALDSLHGAHRVWVLVPTLEAHDPVDAKAAPWIARAERIVTARFNQVGSEVQSIDGGNTRLYLFELSIPAVTAAAN